MYCMKTVISRKKAQNIEAVTQYVYNAGYSAPTALQVKVLPAILAGKNLIIKTKELEGKTACTFLADIISPRTRGFTLIVTENEESTRKTEAHFHRFVQGEDKKFKFFALENANHPDPALFQKESAQPRIVAVEKTTLIDLIRRERFDIKRVERLFIVTEGNRDEDIKDYEYILSKVPLSTQIILFSDNIKKTVRLRSFIRRALRLTERRIINQNRNVYRFLCGEEQVLDQLKKRIKYFPAFSYAVFSSDSSLLQSEIEPSRLFNYSLDNLRKIAKSDKIINVFCLDIPERQDILRQLSALINYSRNKRFLFLYSRDEIGQINRIEEMSLTTMKEKISTSEAEQIKNQAKEITKRIKESRNPELLEAYRKILKKSMPMTARKYLGAYLLLNNDNKKQGRGRKQVANTRKNPVEKNPNAKTLFVSVGKNRKVFPKDLLKLFGTKLDIPTEIFGQVKIFPNYSFIEVPKKYCDKAIKELDGSEFRNVKITVNYSKSGE